MDWLFRGVRAVAIGVSVWCTIAVFGGAAYWLFKTNPDVLYPLVAVILGAGVVLGTGAVAEEVVFSDY